LKKKRENAKMGERNMKIIFCSLAFFFVFCMFFLLSSFLSEEGVYAEDEPDSNLNQVSLEEMGITYFGGQMNIRNFGIMVMSFMGKVVLFCSVSGFIVGGILWVFSADDEGKISRGKDIMFASVLGMSFVLLSYLIVTLLQTVIYSVGET
jgi:hypothetical protein